MADQAALPPELISAILVHLVPKSTFPTPADYASLYQASLVSFTFKECAQPLLVARIGLIGQRKVEELERTLKSRRELRVHVKELLMVMERLGGGRPVAKLEFLPLPNLRTLTLGGWVDLDGFTRAEAPALASFALLAHSSLNYSNRTLWSHLSSLSLGAPCPSTAGIIWPAPAASFPLPRFGSALTSLSITSPLPLSTSPTYLAAFPAELLSNLTFLSLEFSPRWSPSGPQARELGLWQGGLLPLCTSLTTLRLSLITMTPWLSLLLRACPSHVEELQLVVHADEEQLKDLGVYFSRLVLNDVGRLGELKRMKVVDKSGGKVMEGVVSVGLKEFLESRGCEVIEGGMAIR